MRGVASLCSKDCSSPSVLHCYSPFPLEPALEEQLKAAGVHPDGSGDTSGTVSLLIYDSPHRVLTLGQQLNRPQFELATLLEGYRHLKQYANRAPLISAWRLSSISGEQLQQWLLGQSPCPACTPALPEIDPLDAAITRRVLDLAPEILESYLDLELQAELAGGAGDSHYLQRLEASASDGALLTSWWRFNQHQENPQLLQKIDDLREEVDLTVHQLHKTQSQLEELILSSQETDQKLSWNRNKVDALKNELSAQAEALNHSNTTCTNQATQVKNLEEQLTTLKAERDAAATALAAAETCCTHLKQRLQDAQEEAELTLLQLHQVQEELETIFLAKQDIEANLKEVNHKLNWNRSKREQLSQKLNDSAKQKEALLAEMRSSKEDLESKLCQLQSESDTKAQAQQLESSLILKQLHQTQQELERYCNLYQQQEELISKHNAVASRALLLASTQAPRQ